MVEKKVSLAEQTEAAVAAWLKASVAYWDVSTEARKGLNFVIDMVSLSAGYVITCIESNEAPDGKGLATYLAKKATTIAKMIDAQSVQCIASAVDLGISLATDGAQVVTAAASTVGILLAAKAGLSLLLSLQEAWVHCTPLVKKLVADFNRRLDLHRITLESMAKLRIMTLNYQPNETLARTA